MTTWMLTPSPIGELLLLADDDGRVTGCYVDAERGAPAPDPAWRHDAGPSRRAAEQLEAYFEGERTSFELDLAPAGTAFQLEVWARLSDIPYGETVSYRDIAEQVGRPQASRAVGQANGRNPISIIVPCHRVVAADGTLGGYGWGLPRKRWLLDHERKICCSGGPVADPSRPADARRAVGGPG
ncbi:MAG TPA: methylated-DNA--[protein]-cysteine S-methyltransferase [Acidimicrobiales bacterium]|nr:methylated-DNA--[protein]-cysteine S-methyltransferase [Acidimicrobiales bacterium]